MRGLWNWLQMGRHAEAIGALTSIATTIVGAFGFLFAARVYRATIAQVKIAKHQANASQRPYLLLDWQRYRFKKGNYRLLTIFNNGEGPVTKAYWSRNNSDEWVRVGSISKGGKALLKLGDGTHFASRVNDGIRIHYEDLEGNRYFCKATTHRFGIDNENGELATDDTTPLTRSY